MKAEDVRWMIYLNHTLSSWGDRMWDFSVGLYLIILYPSSLILTATLGLCLCLGMILFGSPIGKWIDRNPRLKVATIALLVENSFVIFGSLLLSLNIIFQEEIQPMLSGYMQPILFGLIIISAVLSNLGSSASDIVIERDWIVVLSRGDDKKLSTLNSTMRTIDLTTNILAPLIMGQIITYGSPLAGTIFISSWNFISALIEYFLLYTIYNNVPELAEKSVETTTTVQSFKESFKGWGLYFQHPICFAGLAFAFLFMTVMGFDSITLGYIYTQGASESFIGIVTGVSAIFGILGSIVFPYLRTNIGKHATGNIGFGSNVMFLTLCVGSIFAPGSPFNPLALLRPFEGGGQTTPRIAKSFAQLWTENLNIFYFVFGIVLARFGLWLADLSVTQIIQEGVEEAHRGVINGVQNSLNQFVNLFKFILIIILPSVEAFGFLIFLSWIAMCLAWFLFIIFVCTRSQSSRWPSMQDLMGESQPLISHKQPKAVTFKNEEETFIS